MKPLNMLVLKEDRALKWTWNLCKIEDLERELELNISDINLIEYLKLEKQKLNDLIDQIIKGYRIILRSKAEWVKGSEKNSKYVANLWKE